jgi:hypothetical protein
MYPKSEGIDINDHTPIMHRFVCTLLNNPHSLSPFSSIKKEKRDTSM